jgi:hypothetical protein
MRFRYDRAGEPNSRYMNPEQPAVEQKTRHSFFAASHSITISRRPSYNSAIIMKWNFSIFLWWMKPSVVYLTVTISKVRYVKKVGHIARWVPSFLKK